MADVTFTTTLVKIADTNATHSTKNAGEAIAAADVVYEDTSVSPSVWKKADANATAITAGAKGIALNGAAIGQPVRAILTGNMTCDGLTKGVVYVVSANPGKVAPAADLASGWFVTVLGIATSTTNLLLNPFASAATVP